MSLLIPLCASCMAKLHLAIMKSSFIMNCDCFFVRKSSIYHSRFTICYGKSSRYVKWSRSVFEHFFSCCLHRLCVFLSVLLQVSVALASSTFSFAFSVHCGFKELEKTLQEHGAGEIRKEHAFAREERSCLVCRKGRGLRGHAKRLRYIGKIHHCCLL